MNQEELIKRIESYAAARTTGNAALIKFAAGEIEAALKELFPPKAE